MGFNKKYVRSIEDVQEQLTRDGIESFVTSYEKVEAFIGPIESIRFIGKVLTEYYLVKNESTNISKREFTH